MNRFLLRNRLLPLFAIWQLLSADASAQTTHSRPFEAEILAFEAADKTNPPQCVSATLGQGGQPRPELFLPDRLRMNARGYAIWTAIIEPYLK